MCGISNFQRLFGTHFASMLSPDKGPARGFACVLNLEYYPESEMKKHFPILIAVLWTVFLAPAACLAGALDHYCLSCTEIECGHEVECESDPCQILSTPVRSSSVRDHAPAADLFLANIPGFLGEGSSVNTGQLLSVPIQLDNFLFSLSESGLPLLC